MSINGNFYATTRPSPKTASQAMPMHFAYITQIAKVQS